MRKIIPYKLNIKVKSSEIKKVIDPLNEVEKVCGADF